MAVPGHSWLSNEGLKHLFLLAWLALNAWLFWRTFTLYYNGPQYHYLHQMLGLGLCLSRASASVLNFNCSLVLLPMCRTLLAVLRGTKKVVSRKARRLLDKYKSFHAACGIAICVFSAVHVGAHVINAVNFSTNYNSDFVALNVARYKNEDPRKIIFTTEVEERFTAAYEVGMRQWCSPSLGCVTRFNDFCRDKQENRRKDDLKLCIISLAAAGDVSDGFLLTGY